MPATPLPDSPDLRQLRRRAKELKRAADAGDPDATARLDGTSPTLARAQLVLAREHGFASWPRLVAEVERRTTQTVAERAAAFWPPSPGSGPTGPLACCARPPASSAWTVPAHVDLVGSGWPSPALSTLRLALRKGRPEVAALLRAAGAPDDATPADELIAACFRADRERAQTVLAAHPDLVAALDGTDRAAICDAAHYGRDAGVALMLDLGFPLDATGDYGGTPLHLAAMRGRADLVQTLLRRGADPNLPDAYHGGTAMHWALHGHPRWGHPDRRWRDVVELLLAGGASVDDFELPDDGPIADLLAAAGDSPR